MTVVRGVVEWGPVAFISCIDVSLVIKKLLRRFKAAFFACQVQSGAAKVIFKLNLRSCANQVLNNLAVVLEGCEVKCCFKLI